MAEKLRRTPVSKLGLSQQLAYAFLLTGAETLNEVILQSRVRTITRRIKQNVTNLVGKLVGKGADHVLELGGLGGDATNRELGLDLGEP